LRGSERIWEVKIRGQTGLGEKSEKKAVLRKRMVRRPKGERLTSKGRAPRKNGKRKVGSSLRDKEGTS